jgi:hypothetical protein
MSVHAALEGDAQSHPGMSPARIAISSATTSAAANPTGTFSSRKIPIRSPARALEEGQPRLGPEGSNRRQRKQHYGDSRGRKGAPVATCYERDRNQNAEIRLERQEPDQAAAIAGVTWTFWRRRDPALSNALFLTATFVVTPYAFNYDMAVLSFGVITLLNRADNEPLDYWLILGVWTVPFLTVPLGMAGIPVSCLPVAALAARLIWRRLHRSSGSLAMNVEVGQRIGPVPLANG